jgi:hypothetical protein
VLGLVAEVPGMERQPSFAERVVLALIGPATNPSAETDIERWTCVINVLLAFR